MTRTALITGGSRGLGRALLAATGEDLDAAALLRLVASRPPSGHHSAAEWESPR